MLSLKLRTQPEKAKGPGIHRGQVPTEHSQSSLAIVKLISSKVNSLATSRPPGMLTHIKINTYKTKYYFDFFIIAKVLSK